jgi:hypothetical protein
LKPIEAFLGLITTTPANFVEAVTRAKKVLANNGWTKTKLIYQKIHTPLMFEVIPFLETQGIYDSVERKALYSFYQIEGQVNGRLKCSGEYKNFFIPHVINPEQREKFRPIGTDEVFMYFDYRNMEVSTLQWLSGDDRLGQVLALEEDFYSVVFKLVSGSVCDTEKKRDFCKKFFLPIIYGAGAGSLARELSISLETADSIVSRVNNLFPIALKWIQDRQNNTDMVGVDYFGRKRIFDEQKHGAVRNFVVQASASLICLEKLIDFYTELKGYARLACSIHDGYVVYANKASTKMVTDIGKRTLEEESKLAPGLKLKVSCKLGNSLQDLKLLY